MVDGPSDVTDLYRALPSLRHSEVPSASTTSFMDLGQVGR